MNQIKVSHELYERISEFKQVVEAILEAEISDEEYLEGIIDRGINAILTDIWGGQEQETLVASLRLLAAKHPNQVFKFVAEMLESGASAQQRESLKSKLGFLK